MARINNLLTDKILKNKSAVASQKLATCMALQILDYPKRTRPKEWLIYQSLRGVMLADEVGGGKTFETLALISKAFLEIADNYHSKNRFRVLIIANPSIRSKWEWTEDVNYETFISRNYEAKCDLGKFLNQTHLGKLAHKRLFEFLSGQMAMSSRREWTDLDKYRQGIWLTSFNGLPATIGSNIHSNFKRGHRGKAQFPSNFFDWIIVDEAHSLKNGRIDLDESYKLEGAAIRKIYAVINSNRSSKVVLLTATPFQNNKSELQHLLSLLENVEQKNDINSITGLISLGIDKFEEEFQKLLAGDISLESVSLMKHKFDNDINALISTDKENKLNRPKELRIGGSKNGLDDYLRDVMIRNAKEQLPVKPVPCNMNENDKLQYLLLRSLIKTSEDETQMFSTKLSQLVSSPNSFTSSFIPSKLKQYSNIEKLFGSNLVFEIKFSGLIRTIESIKLSDNKNVITVFVSWLGTVEVLHQLLKNNGYLVFKLTGEINTSERGAKLKEVERASKSSKKKIILLASRVGNEGLDFDKFSNRVIHFDNNFNPAVIDQRNGRIYRGSNISTSKKKVIAKNIEIYQLYLNESYDQRILFIEQEKRKFKNFYLGDSSLQKLLQKTIEKNNLKIEKEILRLIDSIKLDLTPTKGRLLKKYRSEL